LGYDAGCFVKVWNVEEGVLVAQTEVILPETYAFFTALLGQTFTR
jgi:hypothetical protein